MSNNYKETHEKGTYIKADPIQANRDQLFSWTQENGITNAVDSSEYHTTIIYSKNPCPEAKEYDFKLPMHATVSGFKIFDAPLGRCLVAALESEDLKTVNSDIMQRYGATSDYPEYIPHITLSYNYDGDLPTNPPKINVWFNKVEVKGLDPTWAPKK